MRNIYRYEGGYLMRWACLGGRLGIFRFDISPPLSRTSGNCRYRKIEGGFLGSVGLFPSPRAVGVIYTAMRTDNWRGGLVWAEVSH